MPLTTIAYLCASSLAIVGSVFIHPEWGIYGYLTGYNITPVRQWWGAFLPDFARRFAMIYALAIAMGILFQRHKLKCPDVLSALEGLFLALVGTYWLSALISPVSQVDELHWKVLKMAAVLLMAGRVITTRTLYQKTTLVLILVGGYLGYSLSSGAGGFLGGRFDRGFGGSDFAEGNFLAAHFAWLLPLVGVRFLVGSKKEKILCVLSAAFMINGIVLTRSRGAFVALTVGAVATVLLLPRLRSYRKHIVVGLVLGVFAAFSLTDQAFWERMGTLRSDEVSQDASAQSRMDAWKVAVRMWADHPFGVGVGQYRTYTGFYNPALAGRDTHNTYLRCLAETGIQGLLVLMLVIFSSFKLLRRVEKESTGLEATVRGFYEMHAFALRISLVVYLTAAFFISSTYIEEFYWLLMFPVFLMRALKNEEAGTNAREISGALGGLQ